LSTPTLRIIAFSPARVNGGLCVLPLTACVNSEIVGSVEVMRAAARSILAAVAVIPEPVGPKIRKVGSGLKHQVSEETRAKYLRIAARVAAGEASWRQAAIDEGVKPAAAYNWNLHQRAKTRAQDAKAATPPTREVMKLP
jgi:hypothetical protein